MLNFSDQLWSGAVIVYGSFYKDSKFWDVLLFLSHTYAILLF